MTPNKIVSAYRAIKEISVIAFPFKTARAIASLKRCLQEEVGTIVDAEYAMIEKHSGKATGARVDFDHPEKAASFQAEYDDFMNQDADIEFPVVDLSEHTDVISLTPDAIDALDGIVIFEKEETNNG